MGPCENRPRSGNNALPDSPSGVSAPPDGVTSTNRVINPTARRVPPWRLRAMTLQYPLPAQTQRICPDSAIPTVISAASRTPPRRPPPIRNLAFEGCVVTSRVRLWRASHLNHAMLAAPPVSNASTLSFGAAKDCLAISNTFRCHGGRALRGVSTFLNFPGETG